MKEFAVGVDLGGTTVKMGLFRSDGELVKKWEIPTDTSDGGRAILPDIAKSIRAELDGLGISAGDVAGIGIGVPGPVDAETTVHRCVNLGWGVINLRKEMNALIPEIPEIAANNDANVAALGELWQGGGRGFDSAVLITLGTGVGGGVVLNGQIISGCNGGAGEVGHMTVNVHETEQCTCGKYGCLEQYASANGIVRLAKRMLAKSEKPSALRTMDRITSKDICDLAREGEEMSQDILDRWGSYMGRAMGNISCTIDPDVYILGGGMSRAGQLVTSAVLRHYKKYAFHVSQNTGVVLAQLGNDAGIYGGAKMILG
ncbi:MAG: ROK family glucokinase [Oscillibacter sp.]|nr:ROK family glucokinase [Oscillibacter sp.]